MKKKIGDTMLISILHEKRPVQRTGLVAIRGGGGGGGNRTPVRECSTRGFYRLSSSFESRRLHAGEQACARPVRLRFSLRFGRTRTGGQSERMMHIPPYRTSRRRHRLFTQPERIRDRWQLNACRLMTGPAAPRPATSASTIPVETRSPPVNELSTHIRTPPRLARLIACIPRAGRENRPRRLPSPPPRAPHIAPPPQMG